MLEKYYDKYKEIFEFRPLPIREFIKVYVGEVYEGTEEIIEQAMDKRLVIFTGAIGAGKTFSARIILLRIIYELLSLKDPLKVFKVSSIHLAIASRDKPRATRQIFEPLRQMIKNSELKKYIIKDRNDAIGFLKGVELSVQTVDSGLVGENLLAIVVDEFNFIVPTIRFQHLEFVNNILNRIKSRFGNEPIAKLVLISSVLHPSAPLERVINTFPEAFTYRWSIWHLNPKYKNENTFLVCPGLQKFEKGYEQVQEPFIISSPDQCKGCKIFPGQTYETCSQELVEVPETFRHEFTTRLKIALRDFAGIPQTLETSLFTFSEIYSAIDFQMEHPFTHYETTLEDGVTYTNKFLSNPCDIVIHFDLSLGLTSSIGLAIVAYDQYVLDRNKWKLKVIGMLKINPLPGFKFITLREKIIYPLIQNGFNIIKITTDKYQSVEFRQMVEELGIATGVVETRPEIWMTLKNYINEKLVTFYNYPPFIEGALNLQIVEKKLTRLDIEKINYAVSIDVAVATASAVFQAATESPQNIKRPYKIPSIFSGIAEQQKKKVSLFASNWVVFNPADIFNEQEEKKIEEQIIQEIIKYEQSKNKKS